MQSLPLVAPIQLMRGVNKPFFIPTIIQKPENQITYNKHTSENTRLQNKQGHPAQQSHSEPGGSKGPNSVLETNQVSSGKGYITPQAGSKYSSGQHIGSVGSRWVLNEVSSNKRLGLMSPDNRVHRQSTRTGVNKATSDVCGSKLVLGIYMF